MATTYKTGKASWTYGQGISPNRNGGYDRELLGPCPRCGSVTSSYGGGMNCHNDYCQNSANVFAHRADSFPDWWNTDIQVFIDGDMWCAVNDDFVNIQESDCGFGKTPNLAVINLRQCVAQQPMKVSEIENDL